PGNYLKFHFLILHRACSHHNVEPARLDHTVHVQIQKRKFVRGDREVDRLALAGSERDAFEILQLHHGTRDGTHQVADVELNDCYPFDLARVRNGHADSPPAARPDLRGRHFQIRILQGRITQSIAEWEERPLVGEKITAPRCRLVVVGDWQLTD